MKQIEKTLENLIGQSLNAALAEGSLTKHTNDCSCQISVLPSTKPEFGDFQINSALSLAKVFRKSPREIAELIINQLNKIESFKNICKPAEIAGPGFINLTLNESCLISGIFQRLNDSNLCVPKVEVNLKEHQKKPIVVDFSSPNIAKEMHVGHLRSTIIGDSIARVLEFRGYKVLRLNHVGDWGTQFGMLITHLKEVAPQALKESNAIELGDLVTFYREAKIKFDEDKNFQKASRDEVVKLQNGNVDSLKAWSLLCNQSRKEFQIIYDRLNINLIERGESFYNKFLKGVINELDECALLKKDNGAQCVFLNEVKGWKSTSPPVIVQKSDGGFNYATTDLAAIKYRLSAVPEGDGAERLIYVTDSGQASHFESVFEIGKLANWVTNKNQCKHVPFGLVLGADGKKLKTRSGHTVRLKDLLDESVERAKADLISRLSSEKREENEEFINKVSKVIGIASVKYADLSQNRTTNYQFNFDRMLNLQGNTAPYLLYAFVRIAGIQRKGGNINHAINSLKFTTQQEWNLIRHLLKFDDIIIEVEEELLPNRLCNYLFELSQIFNRFYDKIPILKANVIEKSSRLALCKLTADTLQLGLSLLGIETLQRM